MEKNKIKEIISKVLIILIILIVSIPSLLIALVTAFPWIIFFGNIICHLFRIGIYRENNFYIFGIYWRMYAFRSIF